MLLKSLVVPKKNLTVVKESCTLEEAITILEESGYRCVPVLDETETFFRGNIYKMHIYRHKANGGDMSLPVTHLIKNSTKFISVDSSFFKVFFTIKELPYIAVLDKQVNHNTKLGSGLRDRAHAAMSAASSKSAPLTDMSRLSLK